jgi:hypothetical protein
MILWGAQMVQYAVGLGLSAGDSITIGTIGTKNYLLSVVFDFLKLPIVDSFW